MNPFKRLIHYVKQRYSNWRAQKIKEIRTEEIAKTLSIAHAMELSQTPGELWPVKKAEHARQIAAVRAGDITIVDRRSWQYPYLPSSISRIRQPILKMTPYNIRRFAKSPVPRRALNLIKNGVLSLEWDIFPIKGTFNDADPDVKTRIEAARYSFHHPNLTDSYQSLMEQNLEDFILLGAMAVEPQITPDPSRPFKMWSVDASTIRIFPTWNESNTQDEPRYAQMTGLLGERGIVPFMDDELLYLRDNPTNDTPFGLGKMEVAFQSVTHFLGVQEMAGRAGADQLHKTWLWWTGAVAPAQVDQVRRHTTNDLEGQAKVSIVAGAPKPEILEITPVQEADLLLTWQELLIRMICLAFDMSPAKFLERDVNRSTGEVLEDADFRSAVVPVAVKIAEGFTRFILHRMLHWDDLEFKFLNLDDPSVEVKVKLAQQAYAMNALTANEFRASMGQPPLATPLANLTQIELILINTEAAAKIQNDSADKAANRQLTTQQKQMEMYQKQQEQQPQQPELQPGEQQAAAQPGSKPAGPAAVKAPKLTPPKLPTATVLPKLPQVSIPKMPMAGCYLNAKQVAGMTVQDLKSAMDFGLVTSNISLLCDQMETQEPGILEQVSEELQEYLDGLKDKQKEQEQKSQVKVTPKDKKAQVEKFQKFQHRQGTIERDYNVNRQGRPKSQKKDPAEGARSIGKEVNQVRKKKTGTNSRNTKVVRQ